ncbi:MAG: Lin0512 family protein [Clostridia bacterium]|nr:Lin0512 family protein [Clostridia bacterium]
MKEGDEIRRYIIEFGLGMDFHGQDVGRAAEKAVNDAVSKSCLCGLKEVLGIEDIENEVFVNVTIAVSDPDKIQEEKIKQCLPIGKKSIKAVKGGLKIPGLYMPQFGDVDDSIEVAVACVEVGLPEKK